MLYMQKCNSYIKRLDLYVESHFATTSFKAYYFPYAKAYFRINVLRLSPLMNFFRGID